MIAPKQGAWMRKIQVPKHGRTAAAGEYLIFAVARQKLFYNILHPNRVAQERIIAWLSIVCAALEGPWRGLFNPEHLGPNN